MQKVCIKEDFRDIKTGLRPSSTRAGPRVGNATPTLGARPGGLAHGDTQESALPHLNPALPRGIDPARQHADPVPEPKG